MTRGRVILLLLLDFVLVESVVVTSQTEQSQVWEADRAVEQQRIEKECVGKALDLVFIIDSSRSILPRDFERVKDFIVNILRFLDVGLEKTRVGLVLYGSTVEKVFSLDTHGKVEDMERAVRRMEHLATGTMTGMAIKYTADVAFSGQEGARPLGLNIPRVAVIVTDGRPQDPVAEPAARARDSGILIFAVGVGRVDMTTLRLIGSEPHEKHVFFVQNFSMIQTLLSEFHTKICDTDLCGVVGHGCEQICINAPGSFICKCKAGFILNSDQKTCRRIDQCQVGAHGCEHECVSTATSYSCRCRTGFTLNPDGRTCRRTDFCLSARNTCEHECVSTMDSYLCRCRKGYILNPDGKSCRRTDFCLSARNTCEHECVSTMDSYLCRCRKGYILNPDGKSCRQCSNRAIDLVFIIDGSKRLGARNFQLVKQFVNNIVDGLEVAPNATRVGLAQYSARVRTEFPLRRYSTAKEVKAAVSRTKYTSQGLGSGVAVRQLFKQSFRVVEGARPLSHNIPRVAIMFTDGREQGNMAEWATKAKQNGINIYAVGVGETIEEGLQQIASFPQDEHLYYARNARSMGQIAEKVKAQICKGNPSAGDRCKCQAVMAFQIQANEEIQRLTQRLDEVLKRLKTVENYVTTK